MSDIKKGNSLIKAVNKGDCAAIRKLVADGANVNFVGLDDKTPIHFAAQAGQLEAFHTLAELGADLHALALDQTDVLECAAEGGNVEIVQYLLKQGHPIEGHWKPRSKVRERGGHFTPLLSAAINGHVEVVRILLEAGADREAKFDGQTALKLIEPDIRHPNSPEEVKRVPRLKQIKTLLQGSAAPAKSASDLAVAEVQKFAANAKGAAYQKLRQELIKLCGAKRAWKPIPDHGTPASDISIFSWKGVKKQSQLEDLQQKARDSGGHLVLADPWIPGEDASLVLFPTASKAAVVAAVGTEGANYGLRNEDIIDWLHNVDGENPFDLIYCNHEMVGGAFRGTIKGAKKLAEAMVEICPSCLDEGPDTADDLAKVLKKSKSFLLRWD